jgi:hypothetical protein
MIEYELDIAQRELDDGNRVIFSYCSGDQVVCDANNPQVNQKISKGLCRECVSRRLNSIKWLNSGKGELVPLPYSDLRSVDISSISNVLDLIERTSRDNQEIKKIVDTVANGVFDATCSTLMTSIRESTPNIQKYWEKFKLHLEVGLESYFSAINHINQWCPDIAYIYNARINRYWPLMQVMKMQNREYIVYEYPVVGYENYMLFKNMHAHDIRGQSRILYDSVSKSSIDQVEILEQGKVWFENRLSRKKMGYEPIFSGGQKKGKLISDWSDKSFNLSFFVASQDELNLIEEYSSTLPFSQIDCVKKISQQFPKIRIYVRTHPNLKEVDASFISDINSLSVLSNVWVISADSDVDTYELVYKSSLIVSFGSTVGVEAAYMKKPSLIIGTSLYEAFSCSAHVYNEKDLISYINSAIYNHFHLFPNKSAAHLNACKYGWAFSNQGIKPKYINKLRYDLGYMVRGSVRTRIRANFFLKLINRVINLPADLVYIIKRIKKHPDRFLQLSNFSPLNMVAFILSDTPRRK